MLTLLIGIFALYFVGKTVGLAVRLSWGISKVAVSLIFLPLMLIVSLLWNLLPIAMIILLFMGIRACMT